MKTTKEQRTTMPPGRTLEAEENSLISLATDLARKQLVAGTASAQVITHYLKLGSTKERLEKQSLEQDIKLKEAKTDAIKSMARLDELYTEAIKAMKAYSGSSSDANET